MVSAKGFMTPQGDPSKRIPLAKFHVVFGTVLVTLALVFILLEFTVGTQGERFDIMYPAYASCLFTLSTGLGALALGFREGFVGLSIAVFFFDIINGLLIVVAVLTNLDFANLIVFLLFLSLGWVVFVISWLQALLVLTYLCPMCTSARKSFQEADVAFQETLDGVDYEAATDEVREEKEKAVETEVSQKTLADEAEKAEAGKESVTEAGREGEQVPDAVASKATHEVNNETGVTKVYYLIKTDPPELEHAI